MGAGASVPVGAREGRRRCRSLLHDKVVGLRAPHSQQLSLRAKRSNPVLRRRVDCFVASLLATTNLLHVKGQQCRSEFGGRGPYAIWHSEDVFSAKILNVK